VSFLDTACATLTGCRAVGVGGGGGAGGGGSGGGFFGLDPIRNNSFKCFPVVKFIRIVRMHLLITAKVYPVKRKWCKIKELA